MDIGAANVSCCLWLQGVRLWLSNRSDRMWIKLKYKNIEI